MSNVRNDNMDIAGCHDGATCTICLNTRPVAHWLDKSKIYVCKRCAMTVLPRLIADAADVSDFKNLHQWKNKVELELMRGVASAMSRDMPSAQKMREYQREHAKEVREELAAIEAQFAMPPPPPLSPIRQAVENIARRSSIQ